MASSAGSPSTARSTASPASLTWASTPSSSLRDGAGGVAGCCPGPRSTPSSRRSSVSACRAVCPMISTERPACSGWPGSSEPAASACTAIRLTWCATTSCSSLAIRARSPAAARATCWSRSDSARSARASVSLRWVRFLRLSRPAKPAHAEDQQLDEEVVGLGVAGQQLALRNAHDQEGAHRPAHGGRGPLHDREVGDGRPHRHRRVAEAEVVVGGPGQAHGQEYPHRVVATVDQRQGLEDQQRDGPALRVHVGQVREHGAHVHGRQHQRQGQVLLPWRELSRPGRQPLHASIVERDGRRAASSASRSLALLPPQENSRVAGRRRPAWVRPRFAPAAGARDHGTGRRCRYER